MNKRLLSKSQASASEEIPPEDASDSEVESNSDELMEGEEDLENGQDTDEEVEESEGEEDEGEAEDGEEVEDDSEEEDDEEDSADEAEADDENASDDDGADDDDEKEDAAGAGWADAISKVLNTGKKSTSTKSLLLAKAKKDQDTSETGEGPKEKKTLTAAVVKAKKIEMDMVNRVKPDIATDRAKEKRLARLATKGVVQLFNAVREQQKHLKSQLQEAGGSMRKREKVFKNIDKESFLDVLSGQKRKSESVAGENRAAQRAKRMEGETAPKMEAEVKEENEEEDNSTWKVLRDDYMMGAKMKDWDKNADSD